MSSQVPNAILDNNEDITVFCGNADVRVIILQTANCNLARRITEIRKDAIPAGNDIVVILVNENIGSNIVGFDMGGNSTLGLVNIHNPLRSLILVFGVALAEWEKPIT